jgi:small subunit ribosomal protein S16
LGRAKKEDLMPTVIRMRRGGRTHSPYYRIVVQDSRSRDRGPEVDSLGIYHPCARPEPKMEVDIVKAIEWLNKGAQCSDTARNVLSKLGVFAHWKAGTLPEGVEGKVAMTTGPVENKGYNAPPEPKPKAAPVAEAPAEEAAAEAPAEEATAEAPAEEAPATEEQA